MLDSSRYFDLRMKDGRGKHAFVGLGFDERNELRRKCGQQGERG